MQAAPVGLRLTLTRPIVSAVDSMSTAPAPSDSLQKSLPAGLSIGSAVDPASQQRICDVLSTLNFPLSPTALLAAITALLSISSSTRATVVLHRLAAMDRRTRQSTTHHTSLHSRLSLSPLSPLSPSYSPLYAYFCHCFFTSASLSSLSNPTLCAWCLEVLCAGHDTHTFLTALKHAAAYSSAAAPLSHQPPATGQPCSHAFQEGELVYTCTTCQVDPQCAVCVECFEAADHTGHDTALIVTGGGVCDCGDGQAWSEAGSCWRHRGGKAKGVQNEETKERDVGKSTVDEKEEKDSEKTTAETEKKQIERESEESEEEEEDEEEDEDDDDEKDDDNDPGRPSRARLPSSHSQSTSRVSSSPASSTASTPTSTTPDVYSINSATCPLFLPISPFISPFSPTGALLDAELPIRVSGIFSHLILLVCHSMRQLSGTHATQHRRFASMVKVLSWVRKLSRGNTHFLRALALALCQPCTPDWPQLLPYEQWVASSGLLAFHSRSDVDEVVGEGGDSDMSCLDVLLGYCVAPGPTFAPSRLDRVMCEILTSLLSHTFPYTAFSSASPSTYPTPPVNIKLHLLSSSIRHYRPLYLARTKVPQTICVQLLPVPTFVPLLRRLHALRLMVTLLRDVIRQAATRRRVAGVVHRCVDECILDELCNAHVRVLDCRHPCLLHQRHYALKIDIIYLLRHVALADSVWFEDDCEGDVESGGSGGVQLLLLDVLSYLQSMNGMRRIVRGAHVQWESDEWQYAFEVEHDMQQIMELAIARLKPTTQHTRAAVKPAEVTAPFSPPSRSRSASSHVPIAPPLPAPIALRCLLRCLGALVVLLTRDFLTDGILDLRRLDSHTNTLIWCLVQPVEPLTSFHLPLHRLFARLSVYALQLTPHALPLISHFLIRAIHSAIRSFPPTSLSFTVPDAAEASNAGLLRVWWQCFLCAPVRLASGVSEMRARLWLRNGDAMVGQQACYRSPSFALPGLYADVAAMQLGVMQWQDSIRDQQTAGITRGRFDLIEWSADLYHLRAFITDRRAPVTVNDEPPLSDSSLLVLAEDVCRLWLAVLTDRTLYAADACIRSELLHCLAVHASPSHSTLLAALPESLSKSASLPAIDAALAELADFAPPAGTRGGVYRLKGSAWSEYNPFYFRYMTTEMATAEERYREYRKRQPITQPPATAPAATSSRAEVPAAMSGLTALLHRPALHRFVATVLQLFCASHHIQLPPSVLVVFPDRSNALAAPGECSLDRLVQTVLHLLAMAALTVPEWQGFQTPRACAEGVCQCERRPLRLLPPSSPHSTCACLPSTVHQFAHMLRTQPSTILSTGHSMSASMSACEADDAYQRLAALGEMLLCLHRHAQIDSWLAAEPRQQLADVLTLFTMHAKLAWNGSETIDAMEEEQKSSNEVVLATLTASSAEGSNVSAAVSPSKDAVAQVVANKSAPASSPASTAPLSAAARAKLAAKERQAAVLQQFKLKQERFQLAQQNRDGASSQLSAANRRQKLVSESKEEPKLQEQVAMLNLPSSALPPLSPVPSVSPSSSPSPSPSPPHPSTASTRSKAITASPSAADLADGMFGHRSDSVCCLCLDPASADRLLGRVANVHLNGLLAVQHRQQMRALSELVSGAQQPLANEKVKAGGCDVCESTMPEHSLPLHPQLTAKVEAKAAESATVQQPAEDDEKDGRHRKRSKRGKQTQSATPTTPSTPTRSTRRKSPAAQLADSEQHSHSNGSRSVDAEDVVMHDERKESDADAVLERVEVEVKRAELFEAPRQFSAQLSLHEVGFDFLHHWSATARSTVQSSEPLPAVPSLLVSSCGHLLHMNCYAGYVKTLHPGAVGGAEGGPLMDGVSMAVMFPCPACRRMGNACLPLPFFSSDPSATEQQNQLTTALSQLFDGVRSDAALSIKRSLSFDTAPTPSSDLQSFLSHWFAVRPSVSRLLAHTLIQKTRDELSNTQLTINFSAQWQQLLRRVRLHYALPPWDAVGVVWASNMRLLQSIIAHTVLMWELTSRNAVSDAQPTDPASSSSSYEPTPTSISAFILASPFSVRTAEVLRLLLFACERLHELSSATAHLELVDDQLRLITLLVPDVCTSPATAPLPSSQPLLLQQLLPVLIRLSPLLFTTRASPRPLLVSACDDDVPSSTLVRFASVGVVVPMLYYAHILQSMLVLSHVDAAAAQRKRHGVADSHTAAAVSERRANSTKMTDEATSTTQSVAEFEAAQRVPLPSLSSMSLSVLPSSLVSSPSFVSLLSTCCMADVCCLTSLYLVVLACRLRLIVLPRSFSEHVRIQRERQHSEAHRTGTSTQMGSEARWLSLTSGLPHSHTAALSTPSSSATTLVSVVGLMTAAFQSQLRCAYVAFETYRTAEESKHHKPAGRAADNMEHDWQLPSLSSLDHSHDRPTGGSMEAARSPLFSPHLLSLLYMWLVDYWHSCMPLSPDSSAAGASPTVRGGKSASRKRKAEAEAVVAADAVAHSSSFSLPSTSHHSSLQAIVDSLVFPFGSIRCLPCPAIDLSLPLYLNGLPRTFQSLLCFGPVRRCPHCRSSRSSLPSPSSVASVLLCLLCGGHVCANGRNKCHLLHVAACEGDRGCFLSLKRGDCAIIRLDQQQAATAATATAELRDAQEAPSGDGSVAASPAPRDRPTGPPTTTVARSTSASSSATSALLAFPPSPCVSMSTYSYCNWPSLYLDAYGESDLNLVRGRPLYLNATRQQALLALLTQHGGWEEHIQAAMAAQRLQQQQQQQHQHHTQQQQMRMQQQQQQGRREAAADNGMRQEQMEDRVRAAIADRSGDRRRHGRDRERSRR